jgi:hypothetical protein
MGSSARIDLWGKGHRVTRATEEFQRLVPLHRSAPSTLEAAVDSFERWPELLDSLYKCVAKTLPDQYCVRIMEREAMVATPHAVRDAHERDSILIAIAYVAIDWKDHKELVNRIVGARALSVGLGSSLSADLSGANNVVSDKLRRGTFLACRDYALNGEQPQDIGLWRNVLAEVARFRGISGFATPRMRALGANVLIGTRAEAERASADGYFDKRTHALLSLGERLVTWGAEQVEIRPPTQPAPTDGDVVAHVLEIRDGLEKMEASLDRLARGVDAASVERADQERKMDEVRQAVEAGNRRLEAMDGRVTEMHRDARHSQSALLEAFERLTQALRRLWNY